MSTAAISQLSDDPTALITALLQSKLIPSSGVAWADLDLTIYPGKAILTPKVTTYNQPGWNFYGSAVATYQRADMTQVLGDWELRLLVSFPTTYGALAAQVGTILGVNLTAADVVDATITAMEPGAAVVLRAAPTSLLWSGQRVVKLYTSTIPYSESTG